MKKLLAFVAVLVVAFASMGCLSVLPLPNMPTATLRVAGVPLLSRNQVVMTCPSSLALLKVEKLDQWGKEVFVVKPGASVGIRTSGLYGDQAMVLTVYGYQQTGTNEKGEPLFSLVGRVSRDFRFWDSGNNSGQLVTWDVQTSELR